MAAAWLVSSGWAVAIIDAAPLMAEATLPHRTRREIAIDAVISTRERIGPRINLSSGPGGLPVSAAVAWSGGPGNAVCGSDRRNGPPRAGTHRVWAASIVTGVPGRRSRGPGGSAGRRYRAGSPTPRYGTRSARPGGRRRRPGLPVRRRSGFAGPGGAEQGGERLPWPPRPGAGAMGLDGEVGAECGQAGQ